MNCPTSCDPDCDASCHESHQPTFKQEHSLEQQCPGCEQLLPATDLQAQKTHMEAEHPEIIKRRLDEAARWDGWED